MTKDEKKEYDRLYRLKNKERIAVRKKLYNESPAGREHQKTQREKKKKSGYTNEYNKRPEQRLKEKLRRYKREGKNGFKKCIACEEHKQLMEFESWTVAPDGRCHICNDCEAEQREVLGCSTRNVVTAMVMRPYTNLTRKDLCKHPYLIEANKYLILLKNITK